MKRASITNLVRCAAIGAVLAVGGCAAYPNYPGYATGYYGPPVYSDWYGYPDFGVVGWGGGWGGGWRDHDAGWHGGGWHGGAAGQHVAWHRPRGGTPAAFHASHARMLAHSAPAGHGGFRHG